MCIINLLVSSKTDEAAAIHKRDVLNMPGNIAVIVDRRYYFYDIRLGW